MRLARALLLIVVSLPAGQGIAGVLPEDRADLLFHSYDGDGVTILLPPTDDPNFEDPPSVRVKVNDGGPDFTADPSILETGNYDTVISEGDTQVDSFTVDGNTASGTATFVDEQAIFAALGGAADDPEPVRGSFEVTCAGE